MRVIKTMNTVGEIKREDAIAINRNDVSQHQPLWEIPKENVCHSHVNVVLYVKDITLIMNELSSL